MSRDYTIHDEPSKICNICAKKNYNTPEQEREQSKLENRHSQILREFVNAPNPETFNQSRDFVEFVSFMLGNNILIREAITDLFREVLDVTLESIFRADISLDIGYRGQLKSSIAFSNSVLKEFQDWKFVRRKLRNSKKVFITSDNPVVIFNAKNVFIPAETAVEIKTRQISFGKASMPSENSITTDLKLNFTFHSVSLGQDVVMLFPVSPSVCLIGFSDSETHARYMEYPESSVNFIGFANFMIFNQCNKAAYSHSMNLLKGVKADKGISDHYINSGHIPSLDLILGKRRN